MAYQNKGGARWNLEECTHGRAPKARKFLKRGSVKVARAERRKVDLSDLLDNTPTEFVDPRWCAEYELGGSAHSITNGNTIVTITWDASHKPGFYYETYTSGPNGHSRTEGYML